MGSFYIDTIDGYDKQTFALDVNGDVFQLDLLHDNSDYLDKWYNGLINDAIKNVYVLYGFGNGMYVKRILKSAGDDDIIIVYEPEDTIIKKAKELFDLSAVLSDKRLHIIIGDFYEFRTFIIKNTDYSMQNTMNFFEYPNYATIFEYDHEKYSEAVSEFMTRIDMVMKTDFNRAEIRFRNSIANVNNVKNSKSFVDLTNRIDKNTPVIIVASGPSLDKNIDELKRAKGKSIIVSVDSALTALLKKDIIPDMYFSADVIKMKEHFADDRVKRIPAVGISESVPYAFSDESSNYVIVDDMLDFFEKEKCDIIKFDVEGSVANGAFGVFIEAGFKNIIFVGLDLAFTDNLDHSANVINDVPDDERMQSLDSAYVEGINGSAIRTSMQLRLYINEFERQIKSAEDINAVDATEGGALIPGTTVMSLSEAINKYCTEDFDFSSVEAETKELLSDEQKERYIQYVINLSSEFDVIRENLIKTNDIYREILVETKRNYNVNRIKKLYAKSAEIMETVNDSPALKYTESMNTEKAKEIQKNLNVRASDDELMESIKYAQELNEGLIEAAASAKNIFSEYAHLWT